MNKAARIERISLATLGAQRDAVKTVRGLFKQPGEPDYNADAPLPWKEASTRTRAALVLVQGSMAAERARTQASSGPRMFGVVFVPERASSIEEWEAQAKQLEAGRVIDVASVPMEKKGG